jgi:hypothetical protein
MQNEEDQPVRTSTRTRCSGPISVLINLPAMTSCVLAISIIHIKPKALYSRRIILPTGRASLAKLT